ncbi:hypothetical protein BKA82DRAFT_4203309 [Pisolithus tinctorius]|nr:hypothetical protein BKA82DRAFT_4203309 [Pisolithus tinctorius]
MLGFYELQLIILISACFLFLLVERHVSTRKRTAACKGHDPDNLENGGTTTPVNALATPHQALFGGLRTIVTGWLDRKLGRG